MDFKLFQLHAASGLKEPEALRVILRLASGLRKWSRFLYDGEGVRLSSGEYSFERWDSLRSQTLIILRFVVTPIDRLLLETMCCLGSFLACE